MKLIKIGRILRPTLGVALLVAICVTYLSGLKMVTNVDEPLLEYEIPNKLVLDGNGSISLININKQFSQIILSLNSPIMGFSTTPAHNKKKFERHFLYKIDENQNQIIIPPQFQSHTFTIFGSNGNKLEEILFKIEKLQLFQLVFILLPYLVITLYFALNSLLLKKANQHIGNSVLSFLFLCVGIVDILKLQGTISENLSQKIGAPLIVISCLLITHYFISISKRPKSLIGKLLLLPFFLLLITRVKFVGLGQTADSLLLYCYLIGIFTCSFSLFKSNQNGKYLSVNLFLIFCLNVLNDVIPKIEGHTVNHATIHFLLLCFVANHLYENQLNEKRLISKIKLEAIGELSRGIFHDLRSPFSSLYSALTSDNTSKEDLKSLIPQLKKAQDLLDSLMDIAKESPVSMSPISSSLLLKDIEKRHEKELVTNNIKLTIRDSDSMGLLADSRAITRVIDNIVQNAIDEQKKITNKGLYILISTEKTDDKFAKITIENNGSSLPESKEDSIFDSVYTSGKLNGTGIGLSASKQIIESHGGSIGAKNIGSNRVEVFFTIPLSNEDVEKEPKAISDRDNISFILINDDELSLITLREKIKIYTKNNFPKKTYSIKTFTKGEDFLEYEASAQFSLVLCDQNFENESDLSGLDIIKKASKKHEIILFTNELEKLTERNKQISPPLQEQDFTQLVNAYLTKS